MSTATLLPVNQQSTSEDFSKYD